MLLAVSVYCTEQSCGELLDENEARLRAECHMSEKLLGLALPLRETFSRQTVVGNHRLHLDEMFSDTALVKLLDDCPRQHLYAYHMGSDPQRIEENQLVSHEAVNGTELLQAVKEGRLWLNLTRIDRADVACRVLITQMYAQLAELVPGFLPDASQGTLLISSPQALVYYHADGPSSVLWHLRGHKRVWVYPPLDTRYVRSELLEDIFAGVRHEYLPFETSYDDSAQVYDLEPGQWICWPQNSPHRIVNSDSVNVSLSTEHFTRESRRRRQLYLANRYFRTKLGRSGLSMQERGLGASAKILAQRVARKLGLDEVKLRSYQPVLRVQPGAPGGVQPLPPLAADTAVA